jgi:preprotein translocase subunit SecD
MSDQSVGRDPRYSSIGVTQVVLLIAVVLLACACSGGASSSPSTKSHQRPLVFVAELVPVGSATTAQLHEASTIIVHRLQGAGRSGARAVVTGNAITVTATSDFARLRSMLPAVLAPANLLFRPVLCLAPGVTNPRATSSGPLPTSCPTANQQTAANLNVDTSTGAAQASPAPWTELAKYQTTSAPNDDAIETVLLPTLANSGYNGERMLLGPAQVVGEQISSASAAFDSPDWVVDLNFSSSGSTAWDNLAMAQFHALIAIDLDGQVISASLTQPNQGAFTSFGGKVQISGNFTESAAKSLALDLQFGALPVALEMAVTS